ncbi:PAS sensor protein [Sulfuricurvum kujiense DSM 16994]|uniref:PAS sensor protein n=1 Tax=Sulfuricurvum kujiense (strain ATCC BAA-921 / DSM 16994 / JCM 11577 / YK-1) TaxID=709032 RepID=E4U255_SULKY|nr:PAS domain-containing protein [Sulfuricurvum kujiense]ADR34612.1 PAS sensor protein [Sulfuricurvum kujiense DSM 16994]
MENRSPAGESKEAKFENDELFFSITDRTSTILTGNEVFVRISGYKKEELIGQYHNIIRHPDMPRVVFKVLWDHINNDKPVVAYVKNQAKTGEYYWVLAAVFPLNDRFISIRIKPNSQIFAAVRELYFKLLMAEASGGMESSEPMLMGLLAELGYNSYDDFMSDALLSELGEHKKILADIDQNSKVCPEIHTQLGTKLKLLLEYSQVLMHRYERWFEKVDMYKQVKIVFDEKGQELRHLARDIVFLSLNASVASYKVANGGETFGVLASDVRVNAKENDTLIGHIHTLVQSLTDTLNELIFTVSALNIQIEAVSYFLFETLQCHVQSVSSELKENISFLINLVSMYNEKLIALQLKMDCFIKESSTYLDQLERQVMYLGYIQVYGIIEAASNNDEKVGFGGIFSQLKGLIGKTSEEIIVMQKMGHNFHVENQNLMGEAGGIGTLLKQFRTESEIIKTMDE